VNKKGNFTYMICGNKQLSCEGFSSRNMRNILSERNIAGLLFVLVIVAFSFAHEDSKKRSLNYNVVAKSTSPEKLSSSLSANTTKNSDIIAVKGN
jgi:hypothetical protein